MSDHIVSGVGQTKKKYVKKALAFPVQCGGRSTEGTCGLTQRFNQKQVTTGSSTHYKIISKNMEICQHCKKEIETPDFGDGTLDYSNVYEYRGFTFHAECMVAGEKKVEAKRGEVIHVTEHSVHSQRNGEFINNRNKYHLGNVAGDGLPRIRIKEPQILKNYENGIL